MKSLAFCSVNSAKHFQLLNLEVAVEANHWLLPDKCLQSVKTRQGEIHHHVVVFGKILFVFWTSLLSHGVECAVTN